METPSDLPPPPKSFSRRDLESAGVIGWRTWDALRSSDLAEVPCKPGAYMVFRSSLEEPRFVHPSPAGWFKGEDPSVSIERLRQEWVPGAHVLYIGKAAFRKRRNPVEALRERLEEFARFGGGEPVAHHGGRLIWQLADAKTLLVSWHEVTWPVTARDYEKRLLKRFRGVAQRPTALREPDRLGRRRLSGIRACE